MSETRTPSAGALIYCAAMFMCNVWAPLASLILRARSKLNSPGHLIRAKNKNTHQKPGRNVVEDSHALLRFVAFVCSKRTSE